MNKMNDGKEPFQRRFKFLNIMNLRIAEQIFMKYGAGSLTVIYQDTLILIRGTDAP